MTVHGQSELCNLMTLPVRLLSGYKLVFFLVCFILGKLCVKLLSAGIWLLFLNAIGSNQIIWGRPENNYGLLRLLPWLNSEINTNTLPRDASFTFSPLYFSSLPSLPPFAQCQMCAAQKNTSWMESAYQVDVNANMSQHRQRRERRLGVTCWRFFEMWIVK